MRTYPIADTFSTLFILTIAWIDFQRTSAVALMPGQYCGVVAVQDSKTPSQSPVYRANYAPDGALPPPAKTCYEIFLWVRLCLPLSSGTKASPSRLQAQAASPVHTPPTCLLTHRFYSFMNRAVAIQASSQCSWCCSRSAPDPAACKQGSPDHPLHLWHLIFPYAGPVPASTQTAPASASAGVTLPTLSRLFLMSS